MKVFILRWNPEISSYKKKGHKSLCKKVQKENRFLDWSIYDWKKVKPGDAVVLCQVGTKNDGVALLGKFICESYEGDSWRKDGTKIHYANIHIFTAFDRDIDTCFSAKSFEKKFPDIDWHGGHSGICLDSKTGKNLISAIDEELKESNKLPETNFSWFLKNDKRFLPINFLDKKEEILRILSPYNPIVHTCDEEDYCEWLDDDEYAIDITNFVTQEPLRITLYDYALSLWWADWHQDFASINYDYDIFLERLKGLLENKYCILAPLQPKKMRKNQKRQTYEEVAWFISKKALTKDSDKKEFYKELLMLKKDFPEICRVKVTYWDPKLSFTTDL